MVLKEKKVTEKSSNQKKKVIKVGDIANFTITALGLRNVGIDEYSLGYSVLIPNAKLGEKVKAKILKIHLKDTKYAIAKPLERLQTSEISAVSVNPGDLLEVNISNMNQKGAGIVEIANNYKLIIPNATVGEKIKVMITRVKKNYGFAKVITSNISTSFDNQASKLIQGSKFTLTLPKQAKQYGKYAIVTFQDSVLFVKLALGANLGDKVRSNL